MEAIERVPVLIIGGGPAGLTAALLLARAGVQTVLIERHAGTSIHPRARGLNVRTMEIFRALGLESAVQAAGAALAKSRYMLFVETLAGKEIRRVADDELMITGDTLAGFTPCNWSQCAQDELEPILAEAARIAGAQLRFDNEFISLEQAADGVTVRVQERATGTMRTIQADYVLAADGVHSPVREALQIRRVERDVQGYYVNIYFRADLSALVEDRWFGICFVENPEVNGLFLAVNNTDRWLFNAEYHPDKGESPTDFTPERCLELVRKAVGLPDLELELLSALPWEAAARYAENFQSGRVFLVGDAAHSMPPAGGFGLNTAIQDAHNLAWKLAAVVQKTAAAALLETYQAERFPVAAAVVDQSVRDYQADSPDAPAEYGPPGGEQSPEEGMIQMLTLILGTRYQSTAALSAANDAGIKSVVDLRGQPGTRAPHLWLEYNGKRISTLDLFDGSFVLLAGSAGDAWMQAAQDAAQELQLNAYQIGVTVSDIEQRWAAAYGVEADGAILIRPDGVVAWRSEPGDTAHQLRTVVTGIMGHTYEEVGGENHAK